MEDANIEAGQCPNSWQHVIYVTNWAILHLTPTSVRMQQKDVQAGISVVNYTLVKYQTR
jgi:hypothetical protein